ncbi:hypothetical protein jhhlp_001589 [Lomentospora prolificans]|uniref:lytic cellulose monooxygenase (C4-dehydrogenating) n=1 Tax=Lomentospora prolificans TaxID=41688 RepID=A0A2N3NIK8_9PEZI|nr:hypothetical protein jhhlp_001589 [Lomentospora prolificans]
MKLGNNLILVLSGLSFEAVRAHSYVTSFIIDGVTYSGFHPRDPAANPDVIAAWRTEVPDDGWVGANDYDKPDIVCHINATNANGNLELEAGNTISFQWNGWPESHHGPVITYMAYCGEESDSCMRANKTELDFFTVDEVGLISPNETLSLYPSAMGIWATDILISNNNSFSVEIPPTLSPGNYVLRHEIIALHYARKPNLGPQHYPQCVNLMISGNGTAKPEGIPATALYGNPEDSAGLGYDIYQDPLPMPYPIPGPDLIEEAVPSAEQTPNVITSTGTAEAAEPTTT